MGKTGNDNHFQILKGKSELRLVQSGCGGRIMSNEGEEEDRRMVAPSEKELSSIQKQL